MVQLNTTYDKDLKQKVFVLKGEEAYARTTDVLADLISDFNDCSTHIQYARVGLEIEVLRNFGDGFIYIFDGENQLHTYDLPWFDTSTEMNKYYNIDETVDGVVYVDGKLIIGSNDDVDTGFFMAYDTPHNIKVRYSGNKYCLGSSSEILSFEMPIPDLYEGTLTMTSSVNGRYHTGETIDNLVLKYISNGEVSNTKTVQIYEGDTLLKDEIELTNNVASTVSLGTSLSEGRHTLRAVFLGDDESTYTETSLDISVGYQVLLTSAPAVIAKNSPCDIQCQVLDYFNEPVVGGDVVCVEYIPNWGYESISQTALTGQDGIATLSQCYLSDNNCYVNFVHQNHNYYSEKITTRLVTITGLSLQGGTAYVGNNQSTTITGNVSDGGYEMIGLPVHYSYNSSSNTTQVVDVNGSFNINLTGDASGDKTLTVTCGGYSATKTISNVYSYWYKSRAWTGTVEINKNYRIVGGIFTDETSNYKLIASYINTMTLTLLSDDFDYNSNYRLSFNVGAFGLTRATAKIGVGRANAWGNITIEQKIIQDIPLYATVIITYENGVKTVVIDGQTVLSKSVSNGLPVIILSPVDSDTTPRMMFNNLKWEKI